MSRRIRSRLHILMGERKIRSLNELSKLTGISNPTLARIYNETNDRIDFKTTITLCDFFNVPIGELYVLEKEEGED